MAKKKKEGIASYLPPRPPDTCATPPSRQPRATPSPVSRALTALDPLLPALDLRHALTAVDALPTLVARLTLALWGRRLPPLLGSLGAFRSSGHLSALLADRSPFPLGSSLRLWGRHHRIGRLGRPAAGFGAYLPPCDFAHAQMWNGQQKYSFMVVKPSTPQVRENCVYAMSRRCPSAIAIDSQHVGEQRDNNNNKKKQHTGSSL